jgi:N-acetylglutamate synthase-like GNAT family acetyltransferase
MMSSNMKIRPATENDIQITVSILRRSFKTVADRFGFTMENCPRHMSFCTEEYYLKDIQRGARYYLLEDNNQVCGCVALEQKTSDLVYLERLAILPEHRHKGLGAMLVKHIFSEAKAISAKRVEIGLISDDTHLKQWYQNFGFVQTSTKKLDEFPFTVAFMGLDL